MNEGAVSAELGLAGWPAVAEESIIARDVLLAAARRRPPARLPRLHRRIRRRHPLGEGPRHRRDRRGHPAPPAAHRGARCAATTRGSRSTRRCAATRTCWRCGRASPTARSTSSPPTTPRTRSRRRSANGTPPRTAWSASSARCASCRPPSSTPACSAGRMSPGCCPAARRRSAGSPATTPVSLQGQPAAHPLRPAHERPLRRDQAARQEHRTRPTSGASCRAGSWHDPPRRIRRCSTATSSSRDRAERGCRSTAWIERYRSSSSPSCRAGAASACTWAGARARRRQAAPPASAERPGRTRPRDSALRLPLRRHHAAAQPLERIAVSGLGFRGQRRRARHRTRRRPVDRRGVRRFIPAGRSRRRRAGDLDDRPRRRARRPRRRATGCSRRRPTASRSTPTSASSTRKTRLTFSARSRAASRHTPEVRHSDANRHNRGRRPRARGRHPLRRARLRRPRAHPRRGGLRDRHDRLPGDPDRPVLRRPDRAA